MDQCEGDLASESSRSATDITENSPANRGAKSDRFVLTARIRGSCVDKGRVVKGLSLTEGWTVSDRRVVGSITDMAFLMLN